MPIVAVVAAAGAWLFSGAAAAIGGLVGGAGISVVGAAEAIGAVGATVGAIGAVTGDKSLETAGLIMGGIGGIGALASSAGLFGADASTDLFGSSGDVSESVNVTPEVSGIGTDGANVAEDAGVTPEVSGIGTGASAAEPDMIDSINQVGQQASGATSAPMPDAATPATSDAAVSAAATPATPAAASSAAVPQVTGSTTPAPTVNAANGVTGNVGALQPGVNAPPPPSAGTVPNSVAVTAETGGSNPGGYIGGTSSTPSPGFFSNLMSTPLGQYGLIQAGGSLLSGLFNPVTPAQVAALDAQAAQNKAAASITAMQATNMAQPLPTVSSGNAPVKTANVTGTVAPTGLINSPAPTVTGSVTGAAA